MCKAFSCLATKSQKVYWKTGIDSHDELLKIFKKEDDELQEEEPFKFAKIEISPENGDYLRLNKWVYRVDEKVKPEYLLPIHKELCWKEFRKWKKEVYSKINLKEAKNPIHPFKIKRSNKVSKKELELLKTWDSIRASVGDSAWDSIRASVWASVRASVRASVGDSVWASVWDSVGASVWASVWDSVGDSVWASVGDSVWDSVRASVGDSVWASVGDSVWDSIRAYCGSLFTGVDKWEHTEKLKIKGYPYQSLVDLWRKGLVASFDGEKWRLHKGKKAKIIWEGTAKDLKNINQ